MKAHVNRQFIREIEKAFSTIYPYLKIEFPKDGIRWLTVEEEGIDSEHWPRQAQDLLQSEVQLSDDMTVGELESRLQELLAVPVAIFRRSGKSWLETRMTRDWTLKEQNDHGRELANGIK